VSAQIDEWIAEAARQAGEARALSESHPEAFLRRPGQDRWSAAEHVAHLPLTERPYFPVIEASVRSARSRGRLGEGPFKGGVVGNWFARTLEPPVTHRIKTMRQLYPPLALTAEGVVAEFEATRDALRASIELARGVDLDAAKLRSPLLKVLKMPVSSAYPVLLAHARRHLRLAHEAIANVTRPPGP